MCTSVWYQCRVVIYRVWEEGAFLVCYTKKKEITILVIPYEISLRYVLAAIFVARTVWTLDKSRLVLDVCEDFADLGFDLVAELDVVGQECLYGFASLGQFALAVAEP